MRYEFEYEIGEKHELSFECYFPDFDLLADIPIEYYSRMESSTVLYKNAKKGLEPQSVLDDCLGDFSFSIARKTGLKMDKPIIFFDLETTGVDVVKDRIVQIAVTKVYVNGKKEKKLRYIKPLVPIPKDASDIHGIDEETVKNAPKFAEVAKGLRAFIDGCDVAGYNSTSFDVPLLQEEFIRSGVHDWPEPGTRFIDVMHIYHQFNPRTLTAAYMHYCDKDLEGAHDAGADITATMEILDSQIAIHDIPGDSQGLHEFCNEGRVDFAGHLKRREDGQIMFARGKNRGQLISDNKGYAEWMLSKDFPTNTKACIREILFPEKIKEVKQQITNK